MAQPVTTKKRSGDVAAGGSGGRRGFAGPDAPLATRHFAVIVGTGWPKGTRCQLRKLRGARKKLSGGVQQQSGGNPWGAAQMQPSGSSSSSATASASSSPSPHHPPQPPQLVGRPAWPPHVRLRPHRAQLSRICAPRLAAEAAARWSMYTARWRRGSRRLPPAGQ